MSTITVDMIGMDEVLAWIDGMGRRASRAAIMPVMKAAFEPVVEMERAGIESKSGALAGSLAARAGAGDVAGRISVFSSPTATARHAIKHWASPLARRQQQMWAANIDPARKRYSIFYGLFVEKGHAIRGKTHKGAAFVEAKPFAEPAMAAGGEQAGDTAAEQVLDLILGD